MSDPSAPKLWGGRFSTGVDAALYRFQASLPFDRRLWREDITASIAHARMLGAAGHSAEKNRQRCKPRCGNCLPNGTYRVRR